ncbi:MLP1_7 [Sanghuangporus vaninii]
MSDLDDDERPRKCRKVEGNKDDVLRAILHEEIDLEIGLRTRLTETVESRLTWALVLQDVLEKQVLNPEGHYIQDGPNQFADLAIAMFKAANASAELFFPTELPTCFGITENPTPSAKTNDISRSPLQDSQSHRPRHATRPQVQLHHEDRVVKEPNRYLYLRDITSTPVLIYKIACPDCRRSDFPRLQGLLNHCRLKHHREFASHDECVQACASVVPEEEQEFVVGHGLEVTGMSASLQRLFKMAVGSYDGIVAVPEAEEADELADLVKPRSQKKEEEEEGTKDPTFVAKTLGHHKDTPALAPFLGRAPKKRQIHVYDDNRPLDIISVDDDSQRRATKLPWGASSASTEAIEEATPSEDEFADASDGTVASKEPLKAYEGSRFHIPLRLIVNDYSLRLPEDAQESGRATHKWLVSVTTASYSLHISTVLSRMSVDCATDSPALGMPLSVSEPPFSVKGTSNKSFLAQINLEWVGTRNKPTQIEHWVQLHEGKSTRPVKGEEQVLDVELDRHTEVIPRKPDSWKMDWSVKVDQPSKAIDEDQGLTEKLGGTEPDWSLRLRKIAQRFPSTAQDAGLRKLPQVSYFLPLTPQHFLSLVEGRRKAIEWGRARAIWEAFTSSAQDKNMDGSVMKISGPIYVYRWMKAEGLCLGNGASQSGPSSQLHRSVQDLFCSVCGHRVSVHRKGKILRAKDGEGGSGRVCEPLSCAGRMPIVDTQDFLGNQAETVKRRCATKPLIGDDPVHLLGKVDPTLLFGVWKIVSTLSLPCFPALHDPILSDSTPSKGICEAELVPYGILATSLRALIQSLVRSSLQSMELRSESSARANITGLSGSHASKRRLLVPAHVVRGVLEGARKKGQRDLHRALFLTIARLGVAVRDAEPPRDYQDALVLTSKEPMLDPDHEEITVRD